MPLTHRGGLVARNDQAIKAADNVEIWLGDGTSATDSTVGDYKLYFDGTDAKLTGTAQSATNTAGAGLTVTAAAGAGTGAGGAIAITAGASGSGATGNGASVTITAGAAASTNGNGGNVVLAPGALSGSGAKGIVKIGGTAPMPFALNVSRATISSGATISDAEMAGGVIYQDASGGAVTMTTRTGTQIAAYFAGMSVGNALHLFCASNHASNTSTIAGGTDVTLVGSGAVTQTGGQFLLIKTAATTFDLVRVG